MAAALVLAAALLGWSAVGNLVLGEWLYLGRNLLLTGLLVLFARRAGIRWSGLGLAGERWREGARWGGIAALVVAGFVGLGVVLGDHAGPLSALLHDQRADLSPSELAYHTALRIPLGTALFEEVAFRGALLGLLLTRFGVRGAVAVSSVVFGLWHIPPTMVALEVNGIVAGSPEGVLAIVGAVVVTTVAGVLFSALRLVSGSLLAPVLAHWATNSLGLLAAALVDL